MPVLPTLALGYRYRGSVVRSSVRVSSHSARPGHTCRPLRAPSTTADATAPEVRRSAMSTPSVRASGEITGCPRSARQVRAPTRPRYERPAVHTSAIRCPGRSQAGRKGRVGIRPGEAPAARANRRSEPRAGRRPWCSTRSRAALVLRPPPTRCGRPVWGLLRSRPCPRPALGRGSPVLSGRRPPSRSVTREARVSRSRRRSGQASAE